jgi:GntR family transcriptional repressor for pyruvate dehydrogenase complex
MATDDAHPPASQRARTNERISRVLFRQILRGEIAVGEKLPTERRLAQTFQVNRATVREALRYLENLELVAVRQGDGAYVRNYLESGSLEIARTLVRVDTDARREVLTALLEFRRTHTPQAAYTAARRRTPEHLRQLEGVALQRPDLAIIERDRQVHHLIALASGNIINVLLNNFFKDCFYDFGALFFKTDRHCRRSEKFHRDIYTAIADRKAGQARAIVHDVLQYAEKAVLKEIAVRGPARTKGPK